MELIFKAAAISVTAAILSLVIKKDEPSIALLVGAGAGCVVLLSVLGIVKSISSFLSELAEATGMSSVALSVVVKTVGIGIISRFAADVCKDSGLNSAASATELAASVAAIYIALPLMKTVFQMIEGLI
jgi:stage III sporulation protein AD